MEEEGYICYKCNLNVGTTHSDAVSHDCLSNASEIYLIDGTVYPFDPRELTEVPENVSVHWKWTPKLISTLLELRLSRQDEFRSPTCKKKKLWMDISEEFCNHTSISVSYELLDSKYRNLLATYRLNKKRRLHDAKALVTWEYYDIMDSVLGHKRAYKPKPRESLDDILNKSWKSENEVKDEDLKVKWTPELINYLLELRLSKELEFAKPGCKKKKLWLGIAQDLKEFTGTDISYDLCDIKFRNLLATYRVNKRKQIMEDNTKITWEYFEKFDEILGYKELDPLEETLDVPSPESPSHSSGRTIKRFKRGRKCFSDTYLDWMMKKEEEKLIRQEAIWKEKKELKEREIDAIFALANAIGTLSKDPACVFLASRK